MSQAILEIAFRDKFRSLHEQAFQSWFEDIARCLHPNGDFQAVRETQGDGGLDGYVINSQIVYQVYAPARMQELRDSVTAAKIAHDFERAFCFLNGALEEWCFLHNHPEGKIGKASARALNELKTRYPKVSIKVLNVKTLWLIIQNLDEKTLAHLVGSHVAPSEGDMLFATAKGQFISCQFQVAIAGAQEASAIYAREQNPEGQARALQLLAWATCEAAVATRHNPPAKIKAAALVARGFLERSEVLAEQTVHGLIVRARVSQLLGRSSEAQDFCNKAIARDQKGEHLPSALTIKLQLLWGGSAPKGNARARYADLKQTALSVVKKLKGADGIVLRTTLLRTALRFKDHEGIDANFIVGGMAATDIERGDLPLILQCVDEAANNFATEGMWTSADQLVSHAVVLAESFGDANQQADCLLRQAEICVNFNARDKANMALRKALYIARRNATTEPERRCQWVQLEFAARHNLANHQHEWLLADSTTDLSEWSQLANDVDEVSTFLQINQVCFGDKLDEALVALNWCKAEVSRSLGRFGIATECYELARKHCDRSAMSFGHELRVKEAETTALAGHPSQALELLQSIDQRDFNQIKGTRKRLVKGRFEELKKSLEQSVLPILEWWTGSDANELTETTKERGVQAFVAAETEQLFHYWNDLDGQYQDSKPVLHDFWGRGRFLRIAAALRANPEETVSVDAYSVNDIKLAATMLCPLFNTVIVKWKGEIGSGMAFAPHHIDRLIESQCGGGYFLCLADEIEGSYTTLLGYGAFLPQPVINLLDGEGRDLVASGRLLVCPASSIGCVQSSVGWSDELLHNSFLSGVVSAINGTSNGISRTLDLSSVSLPQIRGLSLADLALALDDLEDLLGPYRSLIFRSIRSGDLSHERWESLRALKEDAADALSRLDFEMTKRLQCTSASGAVESADIIVAERPANFQPHNNMNYLRNIAREDRSLAPWIPYWRIRGIGGKLDWFSPNSNHLPKSLPEERQDGCYWLSPPTHAVAIPVVRRA